MSNEQPNLIDRARAYGDGVFETIAIRGGRPRLWELHVERLQSSCERLGLACPNVAALTERIDQKLHANDLHNADATARLVVAAGDSPRGYRRADAGDNEVSLDVYAAKFLPAELYEGGVAIRRCDMRLAIQPALAGIKSLNRLEQVLARAEWTDVNIFEGLLQDLDDRLICGTMSNVFIVVNSTIVTPAITRCGVAGVMRAHVLELLDSANIGCEIRDVHDAELESATECFLTNSQFGVMPVRRCDSKQLAIGEVTRQAQALAAANGVPECAP